MIYINVPYDKKELAKKHGSKWDEEIKKWYFPGDILPGELFCYADYGVLPESVYESETDLCVQKLLSSIEQHIQIFMDNWEKDKPVTPYQGFTLDETQHIFMLVVLKLTTVNVTAYITEVIAAITASNQEAAIGAAEGQSFDFNSLLGWVVGRPNKTAKEVLDRVSSINIDTLIKKYVQQKMGVLFKIEWNKLCKILMSRFDFLADIDVSKLDLLLIQKNNGFLQVKGHNIQFYYSFSDIHTVDNLTNGYLRVNRNGRFVGHVNQLLSYDKLMVDLRNKWYAIHNAKILTVRFNEKTEVKHTDSTGSRWTANTADDRIVLGVIRGGEWFLDQIHTYQVDETLNESKAIAVQAKALFDKA